jgi:hypothetical protein
MALLQSGTRIYGNTTIDTFLTVGANANILSTTVSTSNVTGALTVSGGVGVKGSVYADAVYDGNIEVLTYAQRAFSQANSAAQYANTDNTVIIATTSSSNGTYVPVIQVSANGRVLSVTNTAISVTATEPTVITATTSSSNGTYVPVIQVSANGRVLSVTNTAISVTATEPTVITATTSSSNGAYVPVMQVSANGRVLSVTNTAIDTTYTTAAYTQANTGAGLAQGAFNQANSGAAQANTAQLLSQAAYNQANVTVGVDATQNASITIIQGVDNTQNASITVIQGVDNTQNLSIQAAFDKANSVQGNLDGANANIVISQGVNNTQNASITIIQGVDNTQNASITIIQGVDNTQNLSIQAAFNQANSAAQYANTDNTVIIATTSSSNGAYVPVVQVSANGRVLSVTNTAILASTADATQNLSIQAAYNQANSATQYANTDNTVIIATTSSSNGTYIPVIQVSANGRVLSVTNTAISVTATEPTVITATTSSSNGTYVPVVQVSANGRVLSVTNTAISSAPGNFSVSSNLNFTGTGNRITGDFSNATIASRVMFQTSTVNSATLLGVIPNGTNLQSQIALESDPAASNGQASQFIMIGNTETRIASIVRGTGYYVPITFYTGNAEKMRLDANGRFAIGTTNPPTGSLQTLQFDSGTFNTGLTVTSYGATVSPSIGLRAAGGSNASPSATVTNPMNIVGATTSDGTTFFNTIGITGGPEATPTTGSHPTYFYIATTPTGSTSRLERMRIASDGNVAVGTTGTGSAKFQVFRGPGPQPSGEVYGSDGVQWWSLNSNSGAGHYSPLVSANDHALIYSNGTVDTGGFTIGQWSNSARGIRIDSGGNVGIGIASTSGYRFAVVGSAASSVPLYLTSDATNSYIYSPNPMYIGSTGAYQLAFVTNNAEKMRIASTGAIGLSGANYGTSGQVLTSQGSSAAPVWSDAGGGGATGGGTDKVFWENANTITTNYTISSNKNAGTFGPVTINAGVVVTIPPGSSWTIV